MSYPKKNIVLFGSLPSGFGGMENVFIQFSDYFNRCGRYRVCFCMYELNKEQNDYGWLEHIPYCLYQPNTRFRLLQKIKTTYFFKKYLRNHTPDIVIAYDPLSVHLARIAIRRLKLNIPLLSWLHFSFTRFKPKYHQYALTADYHLAICDNIKAQLIEQGASPERCYVIYNPITHRSETLDRPSNTLLKLLYVGRIQFEDQKNLKEVFLALGKLDKPFRLDLVGNGSDHDMIKLKKLALELGIQDKIYWHDWQTNPWGYVEKTIQTVSALVLTSTFEGFPMILCEALSRGIFCISSDCTTGPSDIIKPTNGLLYPPGNIDALTDCFNVVYNKKDFCAESIKNSVEHLYADTYFKRLDRIFKTILK